jgi:hypothetical protein
MIDDNEVEEQVQEPVYKKKCCHLDHFSDLLAQTEPVVHCKIMKSKEESRMKQRKEVKSLSVQGNAFI